MNTSWLERILNLMFSLATTSTNHVRQRIFQRTSQISQVCRGLRRWNECCVKGILWVACSMFCMLQPNMSFHSAHSTHTDKMNKSNMTLTHTRTLSKGIIQKEEREKEWVCDRWNWNEVEDMHEQNKTSTKLNWTNLMHLRSLSLWTRNIIT